MSLVWPLSSVPLLIALSAFFVVSEYAVVATRPAQLESLRKRGWQKAADAMAALQDRPAAAIGAIQVCITMANLLLGWIGEPAMSGLLQILFGPVIQLWPTVLTGVSTAISFLIVTLLTVVFSELLPKAMTLRSTELATLATARPILAVRWFVSPLVWVMNKTANAVSRPLGFGRVEDLEKQQITVDELKLLAQQAADDGVVTPRERSLILNSLAIGKRRAKDIMVHRTRVAFLELRKSMDQNLAVMDEALHSRLPLCDGGMDHVIGVISAKEFLTAYHAAADITVLTLIARAPIFVPEMMTVDRLLTMFHDRAAQMLIVVDEYGGVEGIITLRDVIDELLKDSD